MEPWPASGPTKEIHHDVQLHPRGPGLDFARSVERVVLVDGAKLAALMIEHGVGVSLRPLKVPKLDADYFGE